MYAIVDIETSGGKFNEEGITEIAVYKFDGEHVIDKFISLVNPERSIDPFVIQLTGITDQMVRNAPKFYEVAKRIIEITNDCIFVAHNVSFDYRVMQTEFRRLGFEYERLTLCTVSLSKKLILDQPSYSLGKLCKSIGIPILERHRANGDAMATVKLFKILLERDFDKEIIKEALKAVDVKILKSSYLKIIDPLPTDSGIFYLHNENGDIVYIGKSKNIKKKVSNFFLQTNKTGIYIQQNVQSVSFEKTGNELIASIKHYQEITNNKPLLNKRILNHSKKVTFSNNDFLIIDKGRNISEKSVILIENNNLTGFAYVELAYQINNIEVLKTLITPIDNTIQLRNIVKEHLIKKRVEKIVRL
ncbi:MAG: exonuclease domain-containing protein [Flavobacteriaceae bacterium]|nr:exonuclease domain-containing protein [Flavobacteriaceae bacterium]